MAVYDINGDAVYHVYDTEGQSANHAYDIDGEVIFTETPTNLSVMTYNVGGWYIGSGQNVPEAKDASYYALQDGILSEYETDILCIQEYWDTFSGAGRTALSVLEPYYEDIEAKNGTSQYFGRAICSNYELSDYTINTYAAEYNRYYDKAYITVDGKQIAIFTTHLGLTEANRQVEAVELLYYLANEPYFILCGDLNTKCTSTSDNDYVNVIKPFVDAGYHCANNTTERGFNMTSYDTSTVSDQGGQCDNIITSANITIDSVVIDTTKLTDSLGDKIDHLPVIAYLTVN